VRRVALAGPSRPLLESGSVSEYAKGALVSAVWVERALSNLFASRPGF
jgi:hypothetical protein